MSNFFSRIFGHKTKTDASQITDNHPSVAAETIESNPPRVIPRRIPASLSSVQLSEIVLSNAPAFSPSWLDLRLETSVLSPPIVSSDYSCFTVVDVETTGLDPVSGEILEVSALRFEHFEPVSLFTALVRPIYFHNVPPSAAAVNGITDDEMNSAVYFRELQTSLQQFLEPTPIIVGHNLPFDVKFLYKSGIRFSPNKLYIDTLENVRSYLGKQGPFFPPRLIRYSLENVCKFFSIPFDDAHYSAADCLATGLVFKSLVADMAQYKRALRTPFLSPEEYISIKSIVPEHDVDKSSSIYHKKIVFTGEMSIERREAMQLAVNAGMSLMNSVTPKTDYLVHGTYINGDYVSSKLKKAQELVETGEGHVQVISEDEFMRLIGAVVEV